MAAFAGKTDFDVNGANQRASLNKFYSNPGVQGNVLFVDSGGSAGSGLTPNSPVVTLIAAQSAATADNDDLVLVLPQHAEAIAGPAGMTFSKAGVTYRGVGTGSKRPTITFGTAIDAQLIVSGARVTFQNMIFDFTGFDAITAAISVTGADVAFEDCTFICQSATISPVLGILTAATATRFRVERCKFLGVQTTTSAATCLGFIKHEVGANFVIRNNYMCGKATQLILNATTILEGLIADNYIHVYTGTKGIALAAGTTGSGFNNRLVVASGTSPIVGAGFSWTGNLYTTEALTIGTPTASAF
jgi:hypothetical protein